MNLLDFILIGWLLISFVLGYKNGLIREVIGIFKNLVAIILAFTFRSELASFLTEMFNWNVGTFGTLVYEIIAFFFIWLAVIVSLSMIERTFTSILDEIPIVGNVFRLLGGVLGFLKTYLIAFVVLAFLSLDFFNLAFVQDSSVARFIVTNTPVISKQLFSGVDIFEEFNRYVNIDQMDEFFTTFNENINRVEQTVNTLNDFNEMLNEYDVNNVINGGKDFESSEEANLKLRELINSGMLEKQQIIEIINAAVNEDQLRYELLEGIE